MTMFINSVLYLMPAIQQIATIDLVEFYYTRELHFSLAWIVTPLLNVCLIYIGIIRLKCLKMGILYLLNAKAIICKLYPLLPAKMYKLSRGNWNVINIRPKYLLLCLFDI